MDNVIFAPLMDNAYEDIYVLCEYTNNFNFNY